MPHHFATRTSTSSSSTSPISYRSAPLPWLSLLDEPSDGRPRPGRDRGGGGTPPRPWRPRIDDLMRECERGDLNSHVLADTRTSN